MATVQCEHCNTAGSDVHPTVVAEYLARVHDRRVHGGGKTAVAR